MTQEQVWLPDAARPVTRDSGGRRLKSIALAITLPLASCNGDTLRGSPSGEEKQSLNIRIKIGGRVVSGTLHDTATARDFISLLPLTIDLKDYASTEKISGLPRKLTKEGASLGADPSVGDIAYYAPWGNLAIYYRDSPYASGLIILGKIDGDLDALKSAAGGKATIGLATP
ncbi:MAG: cyclophilin-like fold protein [Luteolibacter sp.]